MRRILLSIATGLALAASVLAQPSSVHWWKPDVYPADSAVWWTLDPDISETQLQDAWQSLDAHQLRYQERLIRDTRHFEWSGDEISFFVDGSQTPELIPMWMAWERYERLVAAPSWSTQGASPESALLEAAGLSAEGAGQVLSSLADYRARRDARAQQLENSYQALQGLLVQAEAVMGEEALREALENEAYRSIAIAASTSKAVIVAHVRNASRYAPVEAAITVLADDLRPALLAEDWRALRRMLRQRVAPGLSMIRPASPGTRAPNDPGGPVEALVRFHFTDNQGSQPGDGYQFGPSDNNRTVITTVGEAEYVGPFPLYPGADLFLTTVCFLNRESATRRPPLQTSDPDSTTADFLEETPAGAGINVSHSIRTVACNGATGAIDHCLEGGMLDDVSFWGFQKATVMEGLDILDAFIFDTSRREGELPCRDLADVAGGVSGLGAGQLMRLYLSVTENGVEQPQYFIDKAFIGGIPFRFENAAPVGSVVTLTIADTSDGVQCQIDGQASRSYTMPSAGIEGVEIACSGSSDPPSGSVIASLETRLEEWSPWLPPSGTAAVTLQTDQGTQMVDAFFDGTRFFPNPVSVGSGYSAFVDTTGELGCFFDSNPTGIVDGPLNLVLNCSSLPRGSCAIRPELCQTVDGSGCRPQIDYQVTTVTTCSTSFQIINTGSGPSQVFDLDCEPQTTKTIHTYLICLDGVRAPADTSGPLAYFRTGDVDPHHDFMVVEGVARDEQSGIGRLEFFLDGQLITLDNLQTGLFDEETCDDFSTPGCNPYSKFRGELDTTLFADGVHRLAVSVDRGDGGIGTLAETQIVIDNSGAASDDAELISSTLPEALLCAGERWASVTLRNTGSSTWSHDTHALGAVDGSDPFHSWNRRYYVPQGIEVAPGEIHTFWVHLDAPAAPGSFRTDWRMLRLGEAFFGEVAAQEVSVDCQADVRLEVAYMPAAGQSRAIEVVDDGAAGQVDYHYDASLGNFEERPAGPCWGGQDNPSYVGVRLATNLELTGCEFQLSTDSAPRVCGASQLESFQHGAWIPLATDDLLIDPSSCRPFSPARPHMAAGENHWLSLTVYSDGVPITRRVDLRQTNPTPPLPPHLRLVADYLPSSGSAPTRFASGVAAPPAFSYHYDPALGHFEQRPAGPCPGGENPTYLWFHLEGEAIDGCSYETSMEPGWRACPASMVADLNAGEMAVIGTDSYRIDPATCGVQQPPVPWVLPGDTHSVTLRLQSGGQTVERGLRFTKQ